MVLQVGADAWTVGHDRDAALAQMLRRAHAGQQHELRRTDRPCGQNDFATAACRARFAALPPAHADRAPPFEDHALNQTTGFEPDVAALERRLEKRARRRPAPPALLVDVEGAAALVVAGVEVRNRFDAGLPRGGAEGVE